MKTDSCVHLSSCIHIVPAVERNMSQLLLPSEFGLTIDGRKLKLEIGVSSALDLILLGYCGSFFCDGPWRYYIYFTKNMMRVSRTDRICIALYGRNDSSL